MKKIFLAAVICMFSSALFAQLSSPVNFGLHAGLVSTKADTDMSGIKEKADNGMMLGAFLRINLNKWYVQPELNYVSRKSQLEISGDSYDIKTKSLDIPILLGYKIIKLPAFKLRAFAGPVASFKIDDSFSKTFKEEYGDPSFKNAVWNAKVGAGVDVWKLTLDVDYEFGLTDVSSEFLKKNKMVNVTLGFKIF
ncbi:porin family protein [Labilibaculum sp. K2S]|uniref:porin family protein n=1 Tax=Labilibaculum sp. K2S TaxID=3056386 RepID=UPI0025A31699|nr:porin family protein [Labilibaculum sp. K2S]MDM8161728.1 porin family protein [Labilibaculum sp. K2S]